MGKKRKAYVDSYDLETGEIGICSPNLSDGGNRREKLEWWGLEALKMADSEGYERGVEDQKQKNKQAFNLLGWA